MADLDDIDFEILRLLVADARRPYSDIAKRVERSAPTVADRIDRMTELGVIRGFSVDVDRSMIESGAAVMLVVHVATGTTLAICDGLERQPECEHVFAAAGGTVFVRATIAPDEIEGFLIDAVGEDAIREYEVHLLTDARWAPHLRGTGFAIECAECENTVTDEGEVARIGGQRYHFCCPSCLANFQDRYERLQSGVE